MKHTQDTILSVFGLYAECVLFFFGRSYGSTILFRDLLTFRKSFLHTTLETNHGLFISYISLEIVWPSAGSKNK